MEKPMRPKTMLSGRVARPTLQGEPVPESPLDPAPLLLPGQITYIKTDDTTK